MLVPSGVSYHGGSVYSPNGTLILEFDPRINEHLVDLFVPIGNLVGLEVDISTLPDYFTLDGTVYNVNYLEDVQQEFLDLRDAWETELGFTTAKTLRVLRPLIKLLKAMVQQGWF
jgi:hypothetical protein